MKITRVLLASNDNAIYWQFWNPVSRVYRENFGIHPTLIWFGHPTDIAKFGLSQRWGDIIVQAPHPKHHIGWQSAWSIFWFMRMFPEDTFCTMGIDQVPLSPILIRDIPEKFHDDTYLMLADDAYRPQHWDNDGGTSPTSFHIVKGSVAEEVYGFEPTFHSEIEKLANSGIRPFYDQGETKWGIDESYSSHKLRQYRDAGGCISSVGMFAQICRMRIECCRVNEPVYNENSLVDGKLGDAHLCRPFADHKPYIEKILRLIPKI